MADDSLARLGFSTPSGVGPCDFRPCGLRSLVLASLLVVLPLACPGRATAGVLFENCVTAADGSISCDTVPTGKTLMTDVDARYGLLQNASPGWSEFDPYQGYQDDFGGNQT